MKSVIAPELADIVKSQKVGATPTTPPSEIEAYDTQNAAVSQISSDSATKKFALQQEIEALRHQLEEAKANERARKMKDQRAYRYLTKKASKEEFVETFRAAMHINELEEQESKSASQVASATESQSTIPPVDEKATAELKEIVGRFSNWEAKKKTPRFLF